MREICEQSERTPAEHITVFSPLETNFSDTAHLPLDNGSPINYSLSRDKPFVGLRKRDMMTRSVKAHEYAEKRNAILDVAARYITTKGYEQMTLTTLWRLFDEENLLKKELLDYREYMQKVHYRLVPYLW